MWGTSALVPSSYPLPRGLLPPVSHSQTKPAWEPPWWLEKSLAEHSSETFKTRKDKMKSKPFYTFLITELVSLWVNNLTKLVTGTCDKHCRCSPYLSLILLTTNLKLTFPPLQLKVTMSDSSAQKNRGQRLWKSYFFTNEKGFLSFLLQPRKQTQCLEPPYYIRKDNTQELNYKQVRKQNRTFKGS